jgi:hypothetical protein
MPDNKPVSVRLGTEERRLLEEISRVTGVRATSELIRMAILALARERGLTPERVAT